MNIRVEQKLKRKRQNCSSSCLSNMGPNTFSVDTTSGQEPAGSI